MTHTTLIRKAIGHLLKNITCGLHPQYTPGNILEGMQLDEEIVFNFMNDKYSEQIAGVDEDLFWQAIVDTLNSEWYEDKYQRELDELRADIIEVRSWEKTKQSLMPRL